MRAADSVHGIVDEVIRKRVDAEPDGSTLLGLLLQNHESRVAGGLTLEQVRNEAVVIFMAGHETTANTLAWAWYLLALHPEAEERMHKELAQTLGRRYAASRRAGGGGPDCVGRIAGAFALRPC